MTNTDRILEAIRAHPGSTDADLRRRTGIEPHQQVNQICRRLAAAGRILRSTRPDGQIGNVLAVSTAAEQQPSTPSLPPHVYARTKQQTISSTGPWPENPLLVIPCSSRKREGGARDAAGPSVVDLLPADLGTRLAAARRAVASLASVDHTRLPAYLRYDGHFYGAAADVLRPGIGHRRPIVILSGGYGLVTPDEAIGYYDREFNASDWPTGLLEDCLAAMAASLAGEAVLAFLARTTGYSKLVRRTLRRHPGLSAQLVLVNDHQQGGAQTRVPAALGEAFSAYVNGRLTDGWTTSEGLIVHREVLT